MSKKVRLYPKEQAVIDLMSEEGESGRAKLIKADGRLFVSNGDTEMEVDESTLYSL